RGADRRRLGRLNSPCKSRSIGRQTLLWTGSGCSMAVEANPRDLRGSFASRLTRGRVVLIAAVLVFAALVLSDTLTLGQGLIGLVIVAGAALINASGDRDAIAVSNARAD